MEKSNNTGMSHEIELVEVVRCKDCIHNIDGFCAKELTPIGGFSTQEKADNWYCADGERR